MGILIAPRDFRNILKVCASQEVVKKEVLRNHDDNLWWPQSVMDWRKRMIIAGLSTRISYRMIKTFQKVVSTLDSHPYPEIASMGEENFRSIVASLGLTKMRIDFWKSVTDFIKRLEVEGINIKNLDNDSLIHRIQDQVFGSSYKVAQCCALYVKGYHCGIMPVDSGMLEMLCPAIGFPAPNGSYGHEVIRKHLEALASQVDCRTLALEEGYGTLSFPEEGPLTWWAHLVLIYYKRFFSRRNDPAGAPLRTDPLTKDLVAQPNSSMSGKLGGIKNLIVEGLDGTGKTTTADMISLAGFRKAHFAYNPSAHSLYEFYRKCLTESSSIQRRLVFDRSFLSEIVYGPIMRGKNRLSVKELNSLLNILKRQKSVLVYLYAPKNIIMERAKENDVQMIEMNYLKLSERYDVALRLASKCIPVVKIDTSKKHPSEVLRDLLGFEFSKLNLKDLKTR